MPASTFSTPPPPPLSSAREKAEERDWKRVWQCRSWRGPAGEVGERRCLHLDTCQLEVFVLFPFPYRWWCVLGRVKMRNPKEKKFLWWAFSRSELRQVAMSALYCVVLVTTGWRSAVGCPNHRCGDHALNAQLRVSSLVRHSRCTENLMLHVNKQKKTRRTTHNLPPGR